MLPANDMGTTSAYLEMIFIQPKGLVVLPHGEYTDARVADLGPAKSAAFIVPYDTLKNVSSSRY